MTEEIIGGVNGLSTIVHVDKCTQGVLVVSDSGGEHSRLDECLWLESSTLFRELGVQLRRRRSREYMCTVASSRVVEELGDQRRQ